jgi:neutral ceramidase
MRFALFAACLLAGLSPLTAADFRAGVARVDITPPVGHAMGGYSDRKGNATGTHDPLFATVLVLESRSDSGVIETLALVTCDLRSFVSTRVGDLARQRFGVRTTIISVSHTHSGPLTWEARTPWYAQAEDKMVEAIGQAHAAMFPATLEFATGNVTLGFNRRKVVNGQATMWWRNEAKLPSHPVDPTVSALIIKDSGSKTRAVLVNYACHPSVLGPDNLQYSADYPGAMKRYVESQIPGAMCMFVQGGAGDINPYRDKEPVPGGFDVANEMGQELGKTVVAMQARTHPITGAVRTASEIIEVKNRWKPSEKIPIGWTAGVIGGTAGANGGTAPTLGPVGSTFCFAAFPGEPFIDHQITFREKAECGAAMLFGYSYSAGGVWAGYMPTILAAVEGGYGADYNTTVEVGTGELLVDRAVVKLFQLRGLLKDLPEVR